MILFWLVSLFVEYNIKKKFLNFLSSIIRGVYIILFSKGLFKVHGEDPEESGGAGGGRGDRDGEHM